MSWLITGGTGFVGQALTRRALAEGKDVRLALRRPGARPDGGPD